MNNQNLKIVRDNFAIYWKGQNNWQIQNLLRRNFRLLNIMKLQGSNYKEKNNDIMTYYAFFYFFFGLSKNLNIKSLEQI